MKYYLLEINPVPWKVGMLSIVRRNKKMVPIMGRNDELASYKEGVADLLRAQNPKELEGMIRLEFYFWRRTDKLSYDGRKATAGKPDVTNMQKATEDACQGILFHNDTQVTDVRSVLVQESPDINGAVVIGIEGDNGLNLMLKLGDVLINQIQQANTARPPESNLAWGESDDIF